jgi:hypothetical protein
MTLYRWRDSMYAGNFNMCICILYNTICFVDVCSPTQEREDLSEIKVTVVRLFTASTAKHYESTKYPNAIWASTIASLQTAFRHPLANELLWPFCVSSFVLYCHQFVYHLFWDLVRFAGYFINKSSLSLYIPDEAVWSGKEKMLGGGGMIDIFYR